MKKLENSRQEKRGMVFITFLAWIFRLLRKLTRRSHVQGEKRVRVTGASASAGTTIVACLGASATEAIGSYDWIQDLAQRPSLASYRFFRFAEGGNLAYNSLERLPDVIKCHPDFIITLLGENDVLALISEKHSRFVHLTKALPNEPSPLWYRETMQAVVRRLKNETKATIALCSLIPIGEAPYSANPFQAEANRRIEEYSTILKEIAREEGVGYIPFYERMHELIIASPGRAFTSFSFSAFYRDVFRQFVLHKSHDEIGQMGGWRFHRDGLHLNSRSGKLLADLVQGFINTRTDVDNRR